MLLLEEITYDLRLALPAAQVSANTCHHLGAIAGAAFAQAVGLDVLVQQLVGVEFRAITRQADQAQARLVGADERFGNDGAMDRVTVDNQIQLATGLAEQALHEADEQPAVKLAMKDHEGQMATVRDRR